MRAVIVGAMALLIGGAAVAEESEALKSEEDKLSYIFGYQLGKRLANDDIGINVDIYSDGLREALQGGEFRLTNEEAQGVMERFQKQSEDRRKVSGESNRGDGIAYLEKNAKKPGITVLENGLQYKVIKQGEGEKPTLTNTVKVHYRGTLIDGSEFDSSYSRNEPATFPVNRVISGWTAILQIMPVGSHYQVTIPSEMAYGERGAPPSIGPNSVLIFDIELLNIEG